MNDNMKLQLKKELLEAGVKPAEVNKLLPIASSLGLLKNSDTSLSKESKRPNQWFNIAKPATLVVSGLVVGTFLIIISQAALPTSLLFPVQKFSDSIAVSIHPEYRASIMMKRAQQVNQLVVEQASSNQVLATLADYTREASAYKSMSRANYAAFEYCKTNLQQAEAAASPSVRQAITSSLQSLENT
jgi:hypothetical protein